MKNTSLVFLTADYDCDGTSIAAHRVTVPQHRALEFMHDERALADFMLGGELPLYQYARDAFEVMTLAKFLAEYRDVFDDAQDRAEFCGAKDPWGNPGHGYVTVWSNLRDCTAEYESTADLNEYHHYAKLDADMEMYAMMGE